MLVSWATASCGLLDGDDGGSDVGLFEGFEALHTPSEPTGGRYHDCIDRLVVSDPDGGACPWADFYGCSSDECRDGVANGRVFDGVAIAGNQLLWTRDGKLFLMPLDGSDGRIIGYDDAIMDTSLGEARGWQSRFEEVAGTRDGRVFATRQISVIEPQEVRTERQLVEVDPDSNSGGVRVIAPLDELATVMRISEELGLIYLTGDSADWDGQFRLIDYETGEVHRQRGLQNAGLDVLNEERQVGDFGPRGTHLIKPDRIVGNLGTLFSRVPMGDTEYDTTLSGPAAEGEAFGVLAVRRLMTGEVIASRQEWGGGDVTLAWLNDDNTLTTFFGPSDGVPTIHAGTMLDGDLVLYATLDSQRGRRTALYRFELP